MQQQDDVPDTSDTLERQNPEAETEARFEKDATDTVAFVCPMRRRIPTK